jgi:recombination protein RecT
MANITTQQPKFSVAIKSDAYQKLINDTLGDKEVARKFVAEISSVVSNNPMLSNCDAASILSAGLLAQSLNMPLAPALGFCYIVPYGNKAQFQLGYKSLIQMSMRSGQFQRLGVREVHQGEYVGQDEFGDDLFQFSHDYDANQIVGYYAYFQLSNGFKKTMYWTTEQVRAHAKKYSKSFASTSATNVWRDNFDTMACKTVLKLLLNRYAPMSVEMQKAIAADQAVINKDGTYSYVDNEEEVEAPKKNTSRKTVNNSLRGNEQEESQRIAEEQNTNNFNDFIDPVDVKDAEEDNKDYSDGLPFAD